MYHLAIPAIPSLHYVSTGIDGSVCYAGLERVVNFEVEGRQGLVFLGRRPLILWNLPVLINC